MRNQLLLAATISGLLSQPSTGQTRLDLRSQSRNVDFRSADSTKPFKAGAALPATCAQGEVYYLTTEASGDGIYVCSANQTWTRTGHSVAVGGGAPPATCSTGAGYLQSDAANGIYQLYTCAATDKWLSASLQTGVSGQKPASCVKGQVYIAYDTATASYCVVSGSATAWRDAAVPWNALANPTSDLTLNLGAHTTTLQMGQATGIADGLRITDTYDNSGTGRLARFTTATGSQAIPWQADANGVGWQVDASGALKAVGSGESGSVTLSGRDSGSCTLTVPAAGGALVPGSAAECDLGSGTLPLGNVYLAGISTAAATNHFKVTGAATGERTWTLQDSSDVLVGRDTTDVLTHKTIDTAAGNVLKLNGAMLSGVKGNSGTVLEAGSISGVGTLLCTDASGNATTAGCAANSIGVAPFTCPVSGATSVACAHNLGTLTPWAACYDPAGNMLGSTGAATSVASVVASDANHATIAFSGTTTGNCVLSTGSMGPQGAAGPAGSAGQSVTASVEPAGANCANGGTKFVSASGTSFACNGGPGSGDVSTGGAAVYTSSATIDARAAAHTLPSKTGMATNKPSTCTIGEEYFATDSAAGQNKWLCTASNTWTQQTAGGGGGSPTAGSGISVSGSAVSFNPLDPSLFWLDERFCGGGSSSGHIGSLGWTMTNSGSGTATFSSAPIADTDANHPCGIKLSNATSGQGVLLYLEPNGSVTHPAAMFQPGSFRPWEMQLQFRLSHTTGIRFYAGMLNSPVFPSAFNVGCWLRFDTTLADASWQAVCADAGGSYGQATVTGAVDTGFHRLRIWSTAAGAIQFSVDGGASATVSKQLPSGTGLAPMTMYSNDGSNTSRYMELFRWSEVFTGMAVN